MQNQYKCIKNKLFTKKIRIHLLILIFSARGYNQVCLDYILISGDFVTKLARFLQTKIKSVLLMF